MKKQAEECRSTKDEDFSNVSFSKSTTDIRKNTTLKLQEKRNYNSVVLSSLLLLLKRYLYTGLVKCHRYP